MIRFESDIIRINKLIKMKTRIQIATLTCLLFISVRELPAKTDSILYYRHEVSTHVGLGTLSGNRWETFREQMEKRFALSFKHGYAHLSIPLGVRMGLRYMYSFDKHIAIGGQFSYFTGSLNYDHYTKEERVPISPNAFIIEAKDYDNPPLIRAKSFSLMPAVKWSYSKCFYIRGGLGIQQRKYSFDASAIDESAVSPITHTQWQFAYQFVPLGMEFSLPEDELSTLLFKKVSPISFHAELGLGMEGILNIGLSYKFGKNRQVKDGASDHR